jgi:hypothetical protein
VPSLFWVAAPPFSWAAAAQVAVRAVPALQHGGLVALQLCSNDCSDVMMDQSHHMSSMPHQLHTQVPGCRCFNMHRQDARVTTIRHSRRVLLMVVSEGQGQTASPAIDRFHRWVVWIWFANPVLMLAHVCTQVFA